MPLTLPGLEVPPLSLRTSDNLWGLDPSTVRYALGVVQGAGHNAAPDIGWFAEEIAQLDKGAYRLSDARARVTAMFEKVAAVAPPTGILVEQPYGSGARPHPELYYVVGVALEAAATMFPGIAIDVVEPSSWKAASMGQGYGFAKKPQILAWAQNIGYPETCLRCNAEGEKDCKGVVHDQADALGIATCAAVRWCAHRRLR
jgi:Holliday junction resolvasome RuvABC endonuclease subunit